MFSHIASAARVWPTSSFCGPAYRSLFQGADIIFQVLYPAKRDISSLSDLQDALASLKNGDVKYVCLDAANYLELKVSSKSQRAGSEHTEDEYYSAYKPVNGVLIAHAIETRVDGQTENQIIIEKIEANVTMDDGIFKMPVKAPEKKPSGP